MLTTSSQMRQTGFPRMGLSRAWLLLPRLSGLLHSWARDDIAPCACMHPSPCLLRQAVPAAAAYTGPIAAIICCKFAIQAAAQYDFGKGGCSIMRFWVGCQEGAHLHVIRDTAQQED